MKRRLSGQSPHIRSRLSGQSPRIRSQWWVVGCLVAAASIIGCDEGAGESPKDAVDGAGSDAIDTGDDMDGDDSDADDMGGDDSDADDSGDSGFQDADDSDATSLDADANPPVRPHHELVSTAVSRSCIGCQGVQWCGGLPRSDSTGFDLVPGPHSGEEVLFASERWESATWGLGLEECTLLTGDELASVVTPPSGVDVLDAGEMCVEADMEFLSTPLCCHYHEVTQNYDAGYRPLRDLTYVSDVELALSATGGADIGELRVVSEAPPSFDILVPALDGLGQVVNPAPADMVEVQWSGGGHSEEVVLLLESVECPGNTSGLLACRATNDGEFVFPNAVTSSMEWGDAMLLHMFATKRIPLDIPELESPTWSVRSYAWMPIYIESQ